MTGLYREVPIVFTEFSIRGAKPPHSLLRERFGEAGDQTETAIVTYQLSLDLKIFH